MTTNNTTDSNEQQDWKLGSTELGNILAAAQIAYRSRCPFEIDPATVIKICNELCDARRASLAAVEGDVISRADALRILQDARERGNADLRELISELRTLPVTAPDNPICLCAITPSERCPIHAALVNSAAASSPLPAEPPLCELESLRDENKHLREHVADLNHDLEAAIKECNEQHG